MGEPYETRNMYGKGAPRSVDRLISEIAERQYGVIELAQLFYIGLTYDQVDYRVKIGRLHRIHQGVYAVGHQDLSAEGRWKAATLTAQEASLSHGSAAELWEMRERRGGVIHITCPRRARSRPGLRTHESVLPRNETTFRHNIPVTTVPRTLLDIAATEGAKPFERALREAHFKRLPCRHELPTLIARYPGRPGTAIALRVLQAGNYLKRIRSDLESDFLDFCIDRGIQLPETNAHIEVAGRRFEVDCLWRAQRVVAELDGRSAHLIPEQVERDLLRDGILQAAGIPVHRITSHRLETDPAGLERQLRQALTLRRAA